MSSALSKWARATSDGVRLQFSVIQLSRNCSNHIPCMRMAGATATASLSLYYFFRRFPATGRLYLRDSKCPWKAYTKWGRRIGRSHARNEV